MSTGNSNEQMFEQELMAVLNRAISVHNVSVISIHFTLHFHANQIMDKVASENRQYMSEQNPKGH